MKIKMLARFRETGFFGFGQVSAYLFFLFLPFQIDALVVSARLYFSGFFNPFLSHFIYLSDIFLILALLFFGVSYSLSREKMLWDHVRFKFGGLARWIFIYLLVVVTSFFSTVDFVNSLLYFVRILEFFSLFLMMYSGLLDIRRVAGVFIGVIFCVALVGIFQYFAQESLGLRFFGEPVLSSSALGVAKVDVFNAQMLRAYGTFPHPNIFAAYLVFASFLSFVFVERKWLKFFCAFIFLTALFLTFSRSAIFGFILALILYFYLAKVRISYKYILLFLFGVVVFGLLLGFWPVLLERFALTDLHTFNERGLYLQISRDMFVDNIFGVGIGDFTVVMQNYSLQKLDPWLFQPVHNIFFLVFNETGFFGGILFMFIFLYLLFEFMKKALVIAEKNRKFIFSLTGLLIFVMITGFFDHYYISLYQGQALLWIFFGFSGYFLGPKKEALL